MDEKLIDQLYSEALSRGYKKGKNEFLSLMKSDDMAYEDMFSYAQSKGLVSDATQFGSMVGRFQAPYKKKEEPTTVGLPQEMVQFPQQKAPEVQPRTSPTPVGRGAQRQQAMERAAMALPSVDGLSVSAETEPIIKPSVGMAAESTAAPRVGVLPRDVAKREAEREAATPGFIKPLLEGITPERVGMEEEYVVPSLNYQFGPLGFKFEEAGALGDYMKATSPTGETIEISLDAFTGAKEGAEADRLRRFIQAGSMKIKPIDLAKIEKQYQDENRKFVTDEEVKAETKIFSQDADALNQELKDLAKLSQELTNEYNSIQSITDSAVKDSAMKMYEVKSDAYNSRVSSAQSRQESIAQRGATLDKAIGKYTEMKAEEGEYSEYLKDKFMLGIGKMQSWAQSLVTDVKLALLPDEAIMPENEWKKGYIRLAKEAGISTPPLDTEMYAVGMSKADFDKWFESIPEEKRSEFRSRLVDEVKKKEKYGEVEGTGKSTSEILRESVMNLVGTNVSEEYRNRMDQGFVSGAIGGAIESIPAFVGGNRASRLVRLFAQAEDAMYAQMEKDPDFANVSENEKRLISMPVAIATSVLEEIGFRNVIANKGLLNKLTLAALGKAGATTTAKTFGELVRNEVKSGVARGALTIVGASLAEAETGAAQQAAELAVKDIYNAVKGKEMFDTPSSIAEYATEIAKAGVQEAIGGFVLGMPSAISAANRKQGYLGVSDEVFKMFELGAQDDNIRSAYVAKLKEKVNAGEITLADAKDQLNEYRNAISLLNSVPEGLTTEDKKKAMNLLRERRGLEQQVEGKDAALVKPQQNRINAINEELTKISEDAVQKQAAGEVSVQPTTRVSEQMAEGEPQAEPQGVAAEGVQETVTAPLTEEEVAPTEEGPATQLQLETSEQRSMPNEEMIQQASEQMSKMEDEGFSQQAFDATNPEPEVEVIPIQVTENTELANKVEKMGLSQLIGKKINLVMADQLKVGPVKAGKKILQRMGGPLFPLIDGLFGKVAWASMNNSAASAIINGALKSDYTVVYNMNPSAIDSNVAMAQTFIEDVKGLGKEKQQDVFNKVVSQLDGKKFGAKTDQVNQIVSSSKNLTQLMDSISGLDVDTKAKVINLILPSQNVKASTEIGKTLQSEGITIESVRAKNVEQFASNLPAGALTMVLEVQDKNGNKITEATKDEAIITPEQQVSEGLPQHENYPVYIRGKAVAMLNETTPFWNVVKDSLNNINVKVAQVIKQASGRPFTSKEARSAEMRAASMTANKPRTVMAPTPSMYDKFVSLLSRSFPSVEIVKTQEEFDELLANLNAKKLATKNQNVYGAVYNGKLYLNPSLENYNTPVHEFGHIWLNVAKEAGVEL